MGIDRIGRAGGGAGVAPPTSVPLDKTSATGESFHVERPQGAEKPAELSPLERLKAGEIELPQYLDLRVEQATAHLEGRLEPEKLDFLRHSLRIQIESDPALIELVQSATGQVPKPSDDG